MRFVLFVALVAFLGWMFENIIGPWMDLKLLELRARREIEQQRQLHSIIEGECSEVPSQPAPCICEWFDHDTLMLNPRCQSSDHGGVKRMLLVNRLFPTHSRYKIRKE